MSYNFCLLSTCVCVGWGGYFKIEGVVVVGGCWFFFSQAIYYFILASSFFFLVTWTRDGGMHVDSLFLSSLPRGPKRNNSRQKKYSSNCLFFDFFTLPLLWLSSFDAGFGSFLLCGIFSSSRNNLVTWSQYSFFAKINNYNIPYSRCRNSDVKISQKWSTSMIVVLSNSFSNHKS